MKRSGTRRSSLLVLAGVLMAASLAPLSCGDDEGGPNLGVHEAPAPESGSVTAKPPTPAAAQQPLKPTADRPPAPEFAEEAYKRWAVLVATNLIDEARGLCTTWLEDENPSYRIEAHKCLANVEMAQGRLPPAQELNPRASVYQPRSQAASVDAAVKHYDAALAISPLERDSHMGRIDVLILAGRYRDANAALDETLTAFDSREMLPSWFKLLGRFRKLGKYQEGLAYLQVIEKHHPLDHRVVANMAAYYAVLRQYDDALTYSEKSVLLNPDDPINKWNLARLYDSRGELGLADTTYLEALALFQDTDPRARCDYADFLATRLRDPARACSYAETGCADRAEEFCSDES